MPTAGPVMPSKGHLRRTSVRLDTTYVIRQFLPLIGKKAHVLTVATYVSAFETHYLYALPVRQLMEVHHYLSPSYWIVQLILSLNRCQHGGRGVEPSRAQGIRIGPPYR